MEFNRKSQNDFQMIFTPNDSKRFWQNLTESDAFHKSPESDETNEFREFQTFESNDTIR